MEDLTDNVNSWPATAQVEHRVVTTGGKGDLSRDTVA